MKKRILAVAAVFSGSLLCNPFPGHAQEDSTGIRSLDEAIVTAHKYPGKTSLTGKIVTIIGKEEIERSSARDLSQLLATHSGMIVTGANSSPAKDKTLFLRGAAAEYTLVLVDGVPVYDPSGIGGHFDIRNLSLANIERIEILKGSQSTLYGSNAVAGVINFITKKTTDRPLAVDASASVGSYQSFKFNTGIRGKKDRLDYRANYSFHQSAGINDAMKAGTGPFDRDGYQQHAAEIGAGFRAAENFYIRPFIRLGAHEGDLDDGAFADELDFSYTQKSLQAGIKNEIGLGRKMLNLVYQYNLVDRRYIDDSVLSRNGFDIFSLGIYKGSEHFIDACLTAPLSKKIKFTGGLDFRSSGSDQHYRSIGSFPYTSENSSDSLRHEQYSIYGVLNLDHPGGWQLEAGGRLSMHSEYGTKPVFNLNPSYLLDKKWKFFINVSSGFRTPSLYQLYSEFGNRDLEPESSLSLEGGVQLFTKDGRFTTRAVIYKRTVEDILFFHTDPNTFRSAYINQDRQKDHGIELDATLLLGSHGSLRAFYNYTKGKIHTRLNGKDSSYQNLLRRPASHFGIVAGSTLARNFYISGNLTYTGSRKDIYFDPSLFTSVQAELGSYVLLDISLEYGKPKGKLKVFADLRNITDSKYTEISGFNTLGLNVHGGFRFAW